MHPDAVPHEDFVRKNPGGTAKREWKTKYESERVICLGREDFIQLRSSPPWFQWQHLVLDRVTGERILLERYFAPDAMDELNRRAEAALGEEYGLAPGSVTGNFHFEGERFAVSEDFSVDREGIRFHWDKHEIGPAVMGAPVAGLAWSEVSDLLREGAPVPGAPAPPERDTGSSEDPGAVARDLCRQQGARVVLARGQGQAAGDGSPKRPRVYSAVAEAIADLADGDLLWLCAGRHVVRAPVRIGGLRGLTVAGQDAGTVSLVSKVDAPVLSFDDCDGLRVTGLHVVHEVGSWCAENTMEIRGSSDVVVSNCDLDGSGYFGLGLSGCRRVRVEGNVIRNSANGLANWRSSELEVRGNEFRDNASHFLHAPPAQWLEENSIGQEGRRQSADSSVDVSPSFDCTKASNPTEHAICDHPSLSAADARMARLYSTLRSTLSPSARDELREDQRAWLKARQGCRHDALCLARVYETRINSLLELLP